MRLAGVDLRKGLGREQARRRGTRLVALAFALCAFAVSIYQTQVGKIGIAGNGDFDRLLNHIGLRTARPTNWPQPYVVLDYIHGWTPTQGNYWSSFVPAVDGYVHVATWLSGGRFDLSWLGWAYSVCFALVVYSVCSAFEHRLTQIVFGVVAVTALCDANLVAYFNSWYDEPWSLLLLLSALAAILHMRGRRRLPGIAVIGLTALSVLLLTSKSQNAFLGLMFAGGLAFLRSGPGRSGSWRERALPLSCAGIVLISIPLYLDSQAPIYNQQNLYDAVFQELLGHSKDPAADLRWLGLPASWADLKGGNAYMVGSQLKSAQFQHFAAHGGRAKLAELYVAHPGRAVQALLRGSRYGLKAHIYYLGYQQKDGRAPPFSGPCGFCPTSTLTQSVSSQGPLVVACLYVAAIAAALALRRRGGRGHGNAIFFLLVVSAYSLLAAVFGEGQYEETKHLYLFYCSNLLLAALTLAGSVHVLRRQWRRRKPLEATTDLRTSPISVPLATRGAARRCCCG